ncbi:MAG: histidine phosphatase family protein, partial [Gloeomargaritaceae cyanobacterium C42_A2020_066]|nr:histidine phosphatase family protein [Gloeomargaritaceae cyanobacterium C42_A2020_066]
RSLAPAGPPDRVFTSPALRCRQTVTYLLRPWFDHPVRLDVRQDLRELDQGILRGLTWAEAEQRYPQLCQQLLRTPTLIPIPGAESPAAGRQRAEAFLASLLTEAQPGETHWVVSHAGFLMHLISALLGCPQTWGLDIYPTAVFEFALDVSEGRPAGLEAWNPSRWRIGRFNGTDHLGWALDG